MDCGEATNSDVIAALGGKLNPNDEDMVWIGRLLTEISRSEGNVAALGARVPNYVHLVLRLAEAASGVPASDVTRYASRVRLAGQLEDGNLKGIRDWMTRGLAAHPSMFRGSTAGYWARTPGFRPLLVRRGQQRGLPPRAATMGRAVTSRVPLARGDLGI